ncbi:MAG: site-specific integrase [Pseudomonadota bacterium]
MSTKTASRVSPSTLHEVIDALGVRDDLSDQRRQDLRSSLRTFAKVFGKTPDQVPADLAALNRQIAGVTAQMVGLSAPRWANMKSGLTAALSLTGAKVIAGKRRGALATEWEVLLDQVQGRYERARLSRFMSWCTAEGITPAVVRQADVDRFVVALGKESLTERPKAVHRDLALAWGRCRTTVAGWPTVEIKVPNHSRAYALAEADFSETFVTDVEAYLHHLAVLDPFEETPRKAMAPTTLRDVKLRIYQIASALAQSGRDPKTITGLCDLVAPDAAKAALRVQHERNGKRKTGQLANYARTLINAARHWVKVPEEEIDKLRALARSITPKTGGMTDKNRARLRQFDSQDAVQRLIGLPGIVFAALPPLGRLSPAQALRAQSALAVAILILGAPLRIKNLASLQLGVHVLETRPTGLGGKGAATTRHIVLPAHEVKNARDLEFTLPSGLCKYLDIYVTRCLPILVRGGSTYLFPNTSGGSKREDGLSVQIKTFIKRETGLIVNAHLYRHLAAKLYLERNPGDYPTVQMLLGHKDLQTTLRAYVGMEQGDAIKRFDKMMDDLLAEGQDDAE